MRTPKTIYDTRKDILSFFQELAHLPGRRDVVLSAPGTKAEAWKFRQRIYGWRRSVLALIADPSDQQGQRIRQWLHEVIGPRCTKDWLDLTKFTVEPANEPFQYIVTGSVTRPMHGPDIVYEDDPKWKADQTELKNIIKHRLGLVDVEREPVPNIFEGNEWPAEQKDNVVVALQRPKELVAGIDVDRLAQELSVAPEYIVGLIRDLQTQGCPYELLEKSVRHSLGGPNVLA